MSGRLRLYLLWLRGFVAPDRGTYLSLYNSLLNSSAIGPLCSSDSKQSQPFLFVDI